MIELKRCPFCEGEPDLEVGYSDDGAMLCVW